MSDMKHSFILFAAVALTLAACSNDDENLNGGPVELRLSSSLEVQTRAGNDIQGAQFDADEDIDVFIHEDVAAGETATSQATCLQTTSNISPAAEKA